MARYESLPIGFRLSPRTPESGFFFAHPFSPENHCLRKWHLEHANKMSSHNRPERSSFMLLFRNGGVEAHQHLSAEERASLAKRWNDWYDGLAAKNKVAQGQPLGLTGRVVSGRTGERVMDGPYAEGKEVVAGFIVLTVPDIDEATAIAKQCPGLDVGLTVEVRPLVSVSPVLNEVRSRPPA